MIDLISTYWPVVVSVAGFIATIVVIWYNLRNGRKAKLEIQKLRADIIDRESHIHIATFDEIDKYAYRNKALPRIMLFVAIGFVASSVYNVHVVQELKREHERQSLLFRIQGFDSTSWSVSEGLIGFRWDSLSILGLVDSTDLKSQLDTLSIVKGKLRNELYRLCRSMTYERIQSLENQIDSLEREEWELERQLRKERMLHDTTKNNGGKDK